ncbi:cytochrome c oxidase subunit II [Bernardetia sp.]|uniref:cytochrome c oxidase subunit II n=1 Tax=Bernardetia sp. TaxID=1937974 RepID=UPI0025C0A5EA|nr:cytochrome c oxidase subunit II [Bernardetia sp.]
MNGLLIAAVGALFLVLMALIYRVFMLVRVAKDVKEPSNRDGRVGMSNKVNSILFIAFFFVLFASIFAYGFSEKVKYILPEASSEHGVDIDMLFWVTTAVVFFVFILTHILLFFFPYMYRYREHKRATFIPHNNKLEIAWTIVPAVVLTMLVVSGWRVWSEVTDPAPEDALAIEIMGHQFAWKFRYGGKDKKIGKPNYMKIDATNQVGMDFEADESNYDDFMFQELRLPKGRNVLLKIRSRDVLHSVFLPHFRVKMDAVPGMPTQFWFKPTKTAEDVKQELKENNDPNWDAFEYKLACTEICGGSHFAMFAKVTVMEADEFDKWYNEQEAWAAKNVDYLKEQGIKNIPSNLASK